MATEPFSAVAQGVRQKRETEGESIEVEEVELIIEVSNQALQVMTRYLKRYLYTPQSPSWTRWWRG